MTKPVKKMPRNPTVSTASHWLTRSEKVMFKRLVAERMAAGLPLSAIDEATICDFAMARSRLRELRKMLAEAKAEVSELESDRAYVLALFREIDRVARLSAVFSMKVAK